MKTNKTHSQSGFTLIELLVVITIIGILATGGVGIYTTQMQGARDSVRLQNMELINDNLLQYYADKGVYPSIADTTDVSTELAAFIKPYNSNYPKDPKAGIGACWVDTGSTTLQTDSGQQCEAGYFEDKDEFGLPHAIFKIATRLEKQTNIEPGGLTRGDGGNIEGRFEKFAGNGGQAITVDQIQKKRIQ